MDLMCDRRRARARAISQPVHTAAQFTRTKTEKSVNGAAFTVLLTSPTQNMTFWAGQAEIMARFP